MGDRKQQGQTIEGWMEQNTKGIKITSPQCIKTEVILVWVKENDRDRQYKSGQKSTKE